MSIEQASGMVHRVVKQVWGEEWGGCLLRASTDSGSTLGRWSKDGTFEARISWHLGDVWTIGCRRHWAILEFNHPPSDYALEQEVYRVLREVLEETGSEK